jgi:hypothetical protein
MPKDEIGGTRDRIARVEQRQSGQWSTTNQGNSTESLL